MQCDNAQCGGAELTETVIYLCRVCGRSHTSVVQNTEFWDTLSTHDADDDYGSDDCED